MPKIGQACGRGEKRIPISTLKTHRGGVGGWGGGSPPQGKRVRRSLGGDCNFLTGSNARSGEIQKVGGTFRKHNLLATKQTGIVSTGIFKTKKLREGERGI